MRKITLLAIACCGAVALGFTAGWVLTLKEAAPTALGTQVAVEPEPAAGAISSRPSAAPLTSQPQAPQQFLAPIAPATASAQAPRIPATMAGVAATRKCAPDVLGVSRTVEIDTTGGPGFGAEQFKANDFLQQGEVVLTFDDGPWPGNTPAVLAALASQCVKATFFPIGQHASWHPEILKQVVASGHTIGSHTWSHAYLAKKPFAEAKDEIEKGFSAVAATAGQPVAPFFRFPGLSQTSELTAYLAERNIAIFSIDVDSLDFKTKNPEAVIASVMTKLKTRGKGIVLMHDFQHSTAVALPALLLQLKANGFKVVHMKAKDSVRTLPQYDAAMLKLRTGQTADARPTGSVVRTISGPAN
jgi:peptidoglycan/xylan/chitin deacetylase (PgdA/CDA1 family)